MSLKMCFQPTQRHVSIGSTETILDLALKSKIKIHNSCGGMGTCGTCRVIVIKGLEKLEEPNEIEKDLASDRGFSKNERLACQTQPVDGLEVEIPLSSDP
jgi:2Fe-2S ferredoxin